MDYSLSLTIAVWIWVVLSALAAIVSGALAISLALEGDEWYGTAASIACFLASIGFVYFSFSIIGHPVVAAWAWHILAGAAVCFGVFCCFRVFMEHEDAGETFSVVGSTALATVLFMLGLWARRAVVVPQATNVPRAAEIAYSQITVWHNVALTFLALGTLIFLVLFVAANQRGIFPAIESHWGGLGGGLGGWQMSSSLSYLIGAVVFGILFSVVILQEENSANAPAPNPTVKEATRPKPPATTPASEPTSK
jgi:hypothetical protein